MIELENTKICKKCKGKCCKKSGCDYYINDFESLKIDYLENKLKSGEISIVACLNFQTLPNGQKTFEPILYLRARNINRSVVDLISMKTTCSLLTETGCSYTFENRPSGGKNLIPKENNECYPKENQLEKIKEWLPYQKILSRLVKRITKMSVREVIERDIIELVYNYMKGNIDGVSEAEIEDIKVLIYQLKNVVPVLLLKGIEKYENETKFVLRKR